MAVPTRSSGLLGTLSNIGQAVTSTISSLSQPKMTTYTPGQTVPTRTTGTAQTPATGTVLKTLGAYNPYTGGYEQVNSQVGVNQGQYSVGEKQKLWESSGNTGALNMDAFYRKNDGSLGIKPEFVKNVNPSDLTTPDSINAYLNGIANDSFIKNGGKTESTDWAAAAKEMSDALKGTAPQNFNRVEEYNKLRDQYGVANLEGQLTELDKQEQELIAQRRQRTQAEMDKPVAMGVIGGRVSEIERQENERLDAIGRQKSYLSSQLQVKNSTIENMMKMKGEDYQTAAQRYDAEFSKNVQLINLARGIKQDEMTAEDRMKDDARASLTTVYNSILSGGLDPKTMPDSQKIQISRLELQSGLPAGFVQNLYDKNPKSDIVFSSKSTEADGNDYLQVVLRDKVTGEMKTQKLMLGKSAAQVNKEKELAIKQQQANAASAKAAKYKSGGTSTKTTAKDPSKDIQFYQQQVAKGAVSVDAAISSIKAKYPEAAGKDLTPLFK